MSGCSESSDRARLAAYVLATIELVLPAQVKECLHFSEFELENSAERF